MGILNEITPQKEGSQCSPERLSKLEAGRSSFWEYCKLINPSFFKESRTYQKTIADTLQAVYEKQLINPDTGKPYDIIIINLPPGFGKSYSATTFTTWAFGQNQ